MIFLEELREASRQDRGSSEENSESAQGQEPTAGGDEVARPDYQDSLEEDPLGENPRGPVENNPAFETIAALTDTPGTQPEEGNLTTNNDTPTPAEGGPTWRKRNNIFSRMWREISVVPTLTEDTIPILIRCFQEEDWNDWGDCEARDAVDFLKEWKQQAKEWKLSPGTAEKLIKEFGSCRDDKKKVRNTLHQMAAKVKEAYPPERVHGTNAETNMRAHLVQTAATKTEKDRMEALNTEMKMVKDRHDLTPVIEALGKVKDLAPGENLRGQSTETTDRLRMEATLTDAISALVPAVNMVTKSPITSRSIILFAILASAGAVLRDPGDTMMIKNVKIGLHEDETGGRLLSVIWQKEDMEFIQNTEFTDYTDFTKVEARLENLIKNLTFNGDPQMKHEENEEELTKRHCDCVLTTSFPRQNTNRTWVMPHEEVYGSLCHTNDQPSRNKYRVTVRATEQGPECTITPTNETRNRIEEAYQSPSKDLVNALNHNRRHPCITKGGYNLNRIPRSAVMTKKTETLIECILHCTFRHTCTSWMFHDTTRTCWILSITRKYQFAETKEDRARIYTGQRACTPCGLAAKIELPANDRDIWENRCSLTLNAGEENPLKCPCDAIKTYKNNLGRLKAAAMRNGNNNIKEPVNRSIKKDLPKAFQNLLRGPNKIRTGAFLSKLISKGNDIVTRNPSMVVQGMKYAGDIFGLLSDAAKLTAEITNQHNTNRNHNERTKTNRVWFKKTGEIENLLEGRLQTNGAIRRALSVMEETLATATTQKQLALQETATTDPRQMDRGSPAIQIGADWGDTTSKTTLTQIGTNNTRTAATVCPVPTDLDRDLQESPALEGEVDPAITSPEEEWKTDCMHQMEAGEPYLTRCNPGGNPRAWRQTWSTKIETKEGQLSLVRLAPTTPHPTSYTMECNNGPIKITTRGILVILMEVGCEIRTPNGRQLIKKEVTQSKAMANYWILYNKNLNWDYTNDQITDVWHSTAIAIILILMAIEAVRQSVRRYRQTQRRSTGNPQQGSPREPRSN